MASKALPEKQFRAIAPFFFVADVVQSAGWYCDVLGFRVDKLWGEPPSFAMPRRDGLTVMLCQAEDKAQIHTNGVEASDTWDAYIWVRDADAPYAEFNAKGIMVVYPTIDRRYYRNREFAVRDPDGDVLAFALGITRE